MGHSALGCKKRLNSNCKRAEKGSSKNHIQPSSEVATGEHTSHDTGKATNRGHDEPSPNRFVVAGKEGNVGLRTQVVERPKLSDPAHEGVRLQPERDGAAAHGSSVTFEVMAGNASLHPTPTPP